MAYDRTWGILIKQVKTTLGTSFQVSSAKGEATITHEPRGWAIRGDQKLRRTDGRPIVPKEDGKKYDYATGVPDASYYKPYEEQDIGPFVIEGLRTYGDAKDEAYGHLAVIPARVPFSTLDDGTVEANRDKQFLQEQIKAYQMQNPRAKIEEMETFYRQIVESEAYQQRQRARQRQ